MPFGIPTKVLPIDGDGKLKLDTVDPWIAERKRVEAERRELELLEESRKKEEQNRGADADAALDVLDYPRSTDVLFGRGKPFQEYPGNIQFGELIQKYWKLHQQSDRFEKCTISVQIVQHARASGVRFLKKNDSGQGRVGGWIPVNDKVARERVSHTMRNITQSRNKLPAQQAPHAPVTVPVPVAMLPSIAIGVALAPAPAFPSSSSALFEQISVGQISTTTSGGAGGNNLQQNPFEQQRGVVNNQRMLRRHVAIEKDVSSLFVDIPLLAEIH
jgi:hypothetical protein